MAGTLKPISECGLTDSDRIWALVQGWSALDPATGAFLSASHGRTKWGDTKYVLIVPTQTPAERGGLFERYKWGNRDRKFVRAFTLEEAVEAANKKLAKVLKARAGG